jgi:hypothetical protein
MSVGIIRVLTIALLAAAAFVTPAIADDIKRALNDFGLIGSWSRDCSKDSDGKAVFAAPPDGGPTATIYDQRDILITTVYDITEARILSTDQIKIGFHPIKVTRSDGTSPSKDDYDNFHVVFKKAGDEIELISMGFDDLGPPVERANFFERCGD